MEEYLQLLQPSLLQISFEPVLEKNRKNPIFANSITDLNVPTLFKYLTLSNGFWNWDFAKSTSSFIHTIATHNM